MNRIDDLIKKHCPNGVKYIELGSISSIQKGVQFNKINMKESGSYPVVNGGINPSGYIEEYNQTENTITISQGGASAGYVSWQDKKFWLGAHCFAIKPKAVLDNRFLFHYIKSKEYIIQKCKYGAGIPALSQSTVSSMLIPVPPFEVQSDIVNILDNFTELISELTSELTERKKQFQYYLDQYYGVAYKSLLESGNYVHLSDIGQFQRGKRFVKSDSEGLNEGVPCLHYGELYTYYGVYANKSKSFLNQELVERKKLRKAKNGDVVIVGAGENNVDIGVGVAWYGNEDIVVHDACYTYTHLQNAKYISYFLRTNIYHDQIKKYVSEGKICSISSDGIGQAILPLPSINEQNRIVGILDGFDTLCNSLSEGLPAEIETRKRQYEYYREKLLTFKQLKSN